MAKPTFDRESFGFKYVLTCAAATVSESVTYPLDLTKTRLQIQGTKVEDGERPTRKRGMFATANRIARREGVLKLWQGISPAILRHYVYTGVRIGVYEHLREHIFTKNPDGTYTMWKALLSGALGGVLAQMLASPADLVKVQMQMEGLRRVQGLPPRVHGMAHAFQTVFNKGGVLSLWKGWIPNCQRAALVNMADIATYDRIKHVILRETNLKDNYVTHALSSVCAGLAAAIVSTPADVVKTRIMNQPLDEAGRGKFYRSSMDCFSQTVKQEGFFALWKGFVPIWSRMAPWSLTFWVSYEEIRKLTGASSF